MTQGIRIDGQRAASKKAVAEAVKYAAVSRDNGGDGSTAPRVTLVATSFFGNEYSGDVFDAPYGNYFFVGPDEARKRVFYGQITVKPVAGNSRRRIVQVK